MRIREVDWAHIWILGDESIPMHKFICRHCMSGGMRVRAQMVEIACLNDPEKGVFRITGYCRGHAIHRANNKENEVLGPEGLRKFYDLKKVEFITNE